MNMIFWNLTRELISQKKLTQTGLARSIGIEVRTFQDWVYSKKLPDTESAKKIADFLGVSLDYLLTGVKTEDTELIQIYNEIQEPLRETAKNQLRALASIKSPLNTEVPPVE